MGFIAAGGEFTFWSLLVRIILALVFGGLVGTDRAIKGRAAGMRTYTLVCMGAALAMMLGIYLYTMLHTAWFQTADALGLQTDADRIASFVITGIGFVAAGTVIVTRQRRVSGQTTAAGLWASACMGIALGAGFYECAIIGLAFILFSIIILPRVDRKFREHNRFMSVYIETGSIHSLAAIVRHIKGLGAGVRDVEVDKGADPDMGTYNARMDLTLPHRMGHMALLADISNLDAVILIEEL